MKVKITMYQVPLYDMISGKCGGRRDSGLVSNWSTTCLKSISYCQSSLKTFETVYPMKQMLACYFSVIISGELLCFVPTQFTDKNSTSSRQFLETIQVKAVGVNGMGGAH